MTKEDYILRYIADPEGFRYNVYWFLRSPISEGLLEAILDIGDPILAACYAWALTLDDEDYPELTKLVHSSNSISETTKKLPLWKVAFFIARKKHWDPQDD